LAEALVFDLRLSLGQLRLAASAEVPLTGITAISGPSGAGKTTLLRALAGLVPQATGPVRFGAQDWTGRAPDQRRIGFVFQEPRLFPHLSVADNIAYGARRRARPDLVPGLVARLGLADLLSRRTDGLSGGEARRVALARAMASAPDILFLDEPLAGLDGVRRDEVLALIAGTVRAAGLPALYVTHDAAEIAAVADRVLRLEAGRVAGWAPAPQRLRLVQAAAASGGVLALRLGPHLLHLPWNGAPGAAGQGWSLPVEPGRLVQVAGPVGAVSDGVAVPVEIVGPAPGGGLSVDAGGQRLDLPARTAGFHPAGAAVLILAGPRPLRDSMRPESPEPADSRR
jgi:molybdate transport system ATP-binding protein